MSPMYCFYYCQRLFNGMNRVHIYQTHTFNSMASCNKKVISVHLVQMVNYSSISYSDKMETTPYIITTELI